MQSCGVTEQADNDADGREPNGLVEWFRGETVAGRRNQSLAVAGGKSMIRGIWK